jgi:succinyl-CoA synthetase beta subunit/citryl-CoA synthetase large subunit
VIRLLEDDAKRWLRSSGFEVPDGATAATPDDAVRLAAALGGDVMVKALVPSGRRGKAGGVERASSPAAAAAVSGRFLGQPLGDHVVREVYIERAVHVARELYLAFLVDDEGPRVVVSARGGVDIEATSRQTSATLVSVTVDPLRGLTPWRSVDLWRQAGIHGKVLRRLADVTAQLYRLFVSGDAELLEINPLALDEHGELVVVGAMVGIDPAALPRQPQWRDADKRLHPRRTASPREERVAAVDAAIAGPEARYVELEGDIGLLVGGGGAGLYQQDRMRAWGGRPANHSVTPPTGSDNRKLRAVIEAILEHPNLRAVLVGFNFAQMARADIRVATLVQVLEAKGIDPMRCPIVIRLFGAGEAEARARVAGRPGIHYLAREATLDDAVRLAVELAKKAGTGSDP